VADPRALEAYELFHWGNQPDELLEVDEEHSAGETLVALGELTSVVYTTPKGSQELVEWEHEFNEEGAGQAPLLCVDEDNRLRIIGGDYIVTNRGIEG